MTFGQRLRARRRELGLSQVALAARLGISQPAISHWENDQKEPLLSSLVALAKSLEISTDWLVLGTPDAMLSGNTNSAPSAAGTAPGRGSEPHGGPER
jgi:transcriptional regulator with XRE-family HTH domain